MCMDFQGIFENGVVRPTEPVSLPQGAKVEFHAVGEHIESKIERSTQAFFANRPPDELLRASGVRPLRSVDDLAIDWPPEDDIDDFIRRLREWRR